MIERIQRTALKGNIRMPSSKSEAQRVLLATALCTGTSVIRNLGNAHDSVALIGCIKRLGARVEFQDDLVVVTGPISIGDNELTLCPGESGLALRLLIPVCAALGGSYRFIGDGSLTHRSQECFNFLNEEGILRFEQDKGMLPIRLSGKLRAGKYLVDGSTGSQHISGLLMALPLLQGSSELLVMNASSRPYIEMTLATLHQFGIMIETIAPDRYRIPGSQKYLAADVEVEADWSAASCWVSAAALGADIAIAGLTPESLQADRAILQALERAGFDYTFSKGYFSVVHENGKPFVFDASNCPDLFPALVCLAVFIKGTSIIKGVGRLRNKESDRASSLQCEFGKLGADLRIIGDELHVFGGSTLRGAIVQSHNDHRIAMALAIACCLVPGVSEIYGSEAVNKSYPDFWRDLHSLRP